MVENISQATQLESPEIAASQFELAMRAEQSGDSWPHPGYLQVNPVESCHTVDMWRTKPGSSETLLAVNRLKQTIQHILDSDIEASVCMPLCKHGHWTWLCFRRAARSSAETARSKWVAEYRDSLAQAHVQCRDYAVSAMSLAVQIFSADLMDSTNLPIRHEDTVQTDGTSCGFHCLFWAEQEYRRLRGEGQCRVNCQLRTKAASLTAFFQSCMKLKRKAILTAVPEPSQPDPAAGPAPVPLPAAGPPLCLTDEVQLGCSTCRFSKTGCQKWTTTATTTATTTTTTTTCRLLQMLPSEGYPGRCELDKQERTGSQGREDSREDSQ